MQLNNHPILLFVLSLFLLPLSRVFLTKVRKIQFLNSCKVTNLPNHNKRQQLRPISLMCSKENQILRVNKHQFNLSVLSKTRAHSFQIRQNAPFSLKAIQTSSRKDNPLSISKLLNILFSCQTKTNKESHSQSFPILLLDFLAKVPITHQQQTFLRNQSKNNSNQVFFNNSPKPNRPERKTPMLTEIEEGKTQEEYSDIVPFM